MQIRDWTDKDGGKRRTAEVVADNVYFGDSKKDGDGSGNRSGGSYGNSYGSSYGGGYSVPEPGGNHDFAEIGEEDGELPF